MFQLDFTIHHSRLDEVNDFLEKTENVNYSIFENAALGFSKTLDQDLLPVANFFNVEIYDDQENLKKLKEQIEKLFNEDLRNIEIKEIQNEDWIKRYVDSLQPTECEGFSFYSDLMNFEPKEDLIQIKLNSALAFGSGHHQTTQACIQNSKWLFENGFVPKNILDMGCGTGILGICAKKIWPDSKLVGIDIDQSAVQITKSNYDANGILAEAFEGSDISNLSESFDLILCNILKQPLIDLCPKFFEKLNNSGFIITSGYIISQEEEIKACYQKEGFKIMNRILKNEWLSILFQKDV